MNIPNIMYKVNENAVLEHKKTIDTKEKIVRIGIVALFAVFIISIFVVNLIYLEPPKSNPNTNFGQLVWDSIISVPSGTILFIDLIVNYLLLKYTKEFRKDRIILMSILVFVIAIFDNIAIHYPLQREWIAPVHGFVFP